MMCLILLQFLALGKNYTLERYFCTVGKENIFPLLEVELHAFTYYSKTCLNRTPYIPETWTNGK
jgi:hypothetical protein